jgi:hypothetical protein
MAEFFGGVVAGLAAAGLLLILLAPSRRLRAEARLDQEVETRLLLGVDPDAGDDEESGAEPDASRADFDTAELQALRKIGTERPGGSRRRNRR